jgi:hypothetical protein
MEDAIEVCKLIPGLGAVLAVQILKSNLNGTY